MYKSLEQFKIATNSSGTDASEFIEFFKRQSENKKEVEIFELSDTALSQVQVLLDQNLTERKILTCQSMNKRNVLEEEAGQIESYLAVDIDEKVINRLFKKLKQIEQEQIEYETKLEHLQEKKERQ